MGMKADKGKTLQQCSSTRPAASLHSGNRTTSDLADHRSSTSLQRKLIDGINNASHPIMQRQLSAQLEPLQRAAPEEEEMLQGKFETAQRAAPEEEELLQGKFETAQRAAPEEEEMLQGKFEAAPPANRTGMPDNLKPGIESLSGIDLSDVRVHKNSSKPAQLNAHAYAQGSDIHLGSGQEQHLPHEAWHVVQQRQGRVQPTTEVGGEKVNDDASLENEADVMGAKALQMKEDKVR
jgi:hypothetical protein